MSGRTTSAQSLTVVNRGTRDGSLNGKVAFVTGAARGQGRAHAVRLASEGADVIAVDLCDQIDSVPYPMANPDDLAATVKLVEDTGARIVANEADVRDRASLTEALQAGLDEFGRLDIVVANAGIAPMGAGDDGWRDVIDVNLAGVYHTVDVAIPVMIEQGGGAIVLTSSVAGLVAVGGANGGAIGYAAAKHGVVGLMRVYANVLAPDLRRGPGVRRVGNRTGRTWSALCAGANEHGRVVSRRPLGGDRNGPRRAGCRVGPAW